MSVPLQRANKTELSWLASVPLSRDGEQHHNRAHRRRAAEVHDQTRWLPGHDASDQPEKQNEHAKHNTEYERIRKTKGDPRFDGGGIYGWGQWGHQQGC